MHSAHTNTPAHNQLTPNNNKQILLANRKTFCRYTFVQRYQLLAQTNQHAKRHAAANCNNGKAKGTSMEEGWVKGMRCSSPTVICGYSIFAWVTAAPQSNSCWSCGCSCCLPQRLKWWSTTTYTHTSPTIASLWFVCVCEYLR